MNKTNIPLAKRYAAALLDLTLHHDDAGIAANKRRLEQVSADLQSVYGLIEKSPEFSFFLENPVISVEKRLGVWKELCQGKIEPIVYSLVCFLTEQKKTFLLKSICENFAEFYRQEKGILQIKIKSSRALSSQQIEAVSRKFRQRLKKDVVTSVDIDPRLIGGFTVEEGDRIYDLSLRSQLEYFKESVLNA